MPLWFSSTVAEHLAVRSKVGIFDVSHMGRILIRGRNAGTFLRLLSPSALNQLLPGKAKYTVLLNEAGGIKDDVIVYRLEEQVFWMVCNAVNREKVLNWMQERKPADLEVKDETFHWALVAVQGPESQVLVHDVLGYETSSLPRFGFTKFSTEKYEGFLARTGYTGEDGFEIFVPSESCGKLWEEFVEKGAAPCGLSARDTLRLEAALPLYGHEWTEETTPLEAGFEWLIDWKGEFVGKSALLEQKECRLPKILLALQVENGAIARSGTEVLRNGEKAGTVTSGNYAPFLKKSIALWYSVKPILLGETVQVLVRSESHPARVVKKPFYKRR